VPEAVMRPIDLLSDAALPVMILILGMQLERAVWPAGDRNSSGGNFVATIASPLTLTPLIAYLR